MVGVWKWFRSSPLGLGLGWMIVRGMDAFFGMAMVEVSECEGLIGCEVGVLLVIYREEWLGWRHRFLSSTIISVSVSIALFISSLLELLIGFDCKIICFEDWANISLGYKNEVANNLYYFCCSLVSSLMWLAMVQLIFCLLSSPTTSARGEHDSKSPLLGYWR